jgi:hypothetical protein
LAVLPVLEQCKKAKISGPVVGGGKIKIKRSVVYILLKGAEKFIAFAHE